VAGELFRSAKEVPVYRLALIAGLSLTLSACAGIRSGKVIFTEDTEDRYVQLRESQPGYVLRRSGHVENRPDLKDLTEVHGDLDFICTEIHGIENPRITIESKDKGHYQVVYKREDRDALTVIAKPLGLVVSQEEREILALTIRVSPGGHRMKPAEKGKQVNVDAVGVRDEGWRLDGATMDQVARFLETRYRRPVVDLTSLEGRWAITLSEKVVRSLPAANERTQLDDFGLEIRWEKVKLPVIVVKDNAQ
jgi:hypothetical protein